MIKNWFIQGDTHGKVFNALNEIEFIEPNNENAVIILGDAGLNFWLNKTDAKEKARVQSKNVMVYCVRGNHEDRPQNISGMHLVYDENVKGNVYMEDKYPNIRYFLDGGEYEIDGLSTLVMGGAYSVDKNYRIANFTQSNGWCGWFKDELLTTEEMNNIKSHITGKHFNMVLTHTCPISWEPTDLFLSFVNQREVDKSMELFFHNLIATGAITYDYWFFGHYHDDRLVRPGVQMFYKYAENLKDIKHRWEYFKENGQLENWYEKKDPYFYTEGE